MEGEEELFVAHDLLFPLGAVDGLKSVEGGFHLFAGNVEALPVHVVEVRGPADGGLFALCAAADAVDDPLEDAHVFAVAGPEELAVWALAEPVDVEDAGRGGEVALHLEPVTEVVAHVVAAEGKHGHGVAADFADGAAGCCGGFRAHGGADVDAGGPVEGLVDERHGGGTAAAEDEGGDGDAVGVLPVGVDGGALGGGGGEAAVGVGGGLAGFFGDGGGPAVAAPVDEFGGWGVGHALPPDAALGGEGYVGEDGVFGEGGHGVGVGFGAGAGGYAEEAVLGIDGAELAGGVGFDPGDVVADGPDLPAFETGGRDHHGEVGFAAGAGEGGGDVGLFGGAVGALGGFDADDEHVLGHPAFVAGDVGGDAEGEAFFAEERVAAVAAAVGPDLAGFGEVDDVLFVVAGPGDVLLAGCEGCADGVHAGDDALFVFVDFGEDGGADAGHDAHVDDGVGGVGELDADLGHGRADGAHGVGKDVHGAAAHGCRGRGLLELLAHHVGVFPVVGGAGGVFGERADEGAIFDAGDVVGGGAGEEAAGPELFVELGEGAGVDELVAEEVVLGLRAVDPVDAVGLAEVGHLFDPADEVFVGGGWGCDGCFGGYCLHKVGAKSFAYKSSPLTEGCQP